MSPRLQRGFSLLEMLVAMGISLALITAGLAAGVQLQRRAVLEETAMDTQNHARAARELLTSYLVGAGAGMGASRINFGSLPDGGSDDRYPVTVDSNAAFAEDTSFALPSGPYADLASDALSVWTADTGLMVPLDLCGGTGRYRSGTNACTLGAVPTELDGMSIVFTNPTLGVACNHVVTSLPSTDRIQTNPGRNNNPPPSSEPCDEAAGSFWSTPGTYAMLLRGSALRVNWASGNPVLEMDPDGVDNAAQGWQEVSGSVERMKVRMAISNPADPASTLVWFPDADGGTPSLDACTNATCEGVILDGGGDYGPSDLASGHPNRARDGLFRRVRMLEIELTTRSLRSAQEWVQLGSDGGFALDENGYLRDGYRRYFSVIRVAPRNAGIGGVNP